MPRCQDQEGSRVFQRTVFPHDLEASVVPSVGVPVLSCPVPAGFPSPADDYTEQRIDLAAHLTPNREASFLVRVAGESMVGFGIHDGDLLVVDRTLRAVDRSVVIAVVDGEFTVKQLCILAEGVLLRAGSRPHADIFVGPEQELVIWGVVRWSLHKVWACPEASP